MSDLKRHPMIAHQFVQPVFEVVFHVCVPFRMNRFGPALGDVVATEQLDRGLRPSTFVVTLDVRRIVPSINRDFEIQPLFVGKALALPGTESISGAHPID
jgi:hypothetical protein